MARTKLEGRRAKARWRRSAKAKDKARAEAKARRWAAKEERTECPHCHILRTQEEEHPDCSGAEKIKSIVASVAAVLRGRAYIKKPRFLSKKISYFSGFKRVRDLGRAFYRSLGYHYEEGALAKVGFNEVIKPIVLGLESLAGLIGRADDFKRRFVYTT